MDVYAVFGHPIGHSKSPQIHSYFAKATRQEMEYTAIQPPLDGFRQEAELFLSHGGRGFNVTVPFKAQAAEWVAHLSERAELAGAVNTVYFDEHEQICGENTDGAGLIQDLVVNHRIPLAGQRILLMGAGGAVNGVLRPLLDCHPAEIVIANRTLARAEALVERFSAWGKLSACAFDELSGAFDTIINGTSAGLTGAVPEVPDEIIGEATVAYDMLYGDHMTPFNTWAQRKGAVRQIDGLGMLVEQAAEAFAIWRGVRPETQPVIEALRNI